MRLEHYIAVIDQFLNRVQRLTASAVGGPWGKLCKEAERIQGEILPILDTLGFTI